MIKHIPNTLTCLNLMCGLAAIAAASYWEFRSAAYLVMAGAIFDFLDGTAARLLNARSPIGKELDSLADVITFGAAPALILYFYVADKAYAFSQFFGAYNTTWDVYLINFCCFLVPVFSALRLAKFNLDDRQTSSFLGLPTPANGLFLISIPLIDPLIIPEKYYLNTPVFASICLAVCFLLVSEVPLFSFKLNDFKLKKHFFQLLFIIISVITIYLLQFTAAPFLLLLYLVLSLLEHRWNKAPNVKDRVISK